MSHHRCARAHAHTDIYISENACDIVKIMNTIGIERKERETIYIFHTANVHCFSFLMKEANISVNIKNCPVHTNNFDKAYP